MWQMHASEDLGQQKQYLRLSTFPTPQYLWLVLALSPSNTEMDRN